MNKILLTSATVLFIALNTFSKEGNKCTTKCNAKTDHKECSKDATCNKSKSKTDTKNNTNKSCCKMDEVKKSDKSIVK